MGLMSIFNIEESVKKGVVAKLKAMAAQQKCPPCFIGVVL